VDYVAHFGREVAAFETAARAALGAEPAPAVPSCPGWRVTNLVLHLGTVHRYVARVIAERLPEPPEEEDLTWLAAPGEYWLTVSSQAGDVNLDRLDGALQAFLDGAATGEAPGERRDDDEETAILVGLHHDRSGAHFVHPVTARRGVHRR